MSLPTNARRPAGLAVIALTIGFAACAQPAEPDAETETTKVIGVEDVGGGELQVADPQPGEVPVNLPQTPMKNVPAEAGEDAAAPAPARDETRD